MIRNIWFSMGQGWRSGMASAEDLSSVYYVPSARPRVSYNSLYAHLWTWRLH